MNFNDIKKEDKEYIANTYNRFDVAIKEGNGATLYDFEGKKYIDFSSGIGVNALGINDKEWVDAVCNQAHQIQHISNLYYTLPQAELAKLLIQKSNMKKVFFCNSGAEANEGAIKTARKYSYDKYGEGRKDIITLEGSFHGRTIATLTATGQDKFHQYFGPFVEGFKYAKINDLENLKSMIDEHTCAIMIETIQGEGGVNNLDAEFIKGIDKLCKDNDLIFIVDEVQTGNGRTGYFYSFEEYGVTPDVVSTAKGLAGGLPFGAVLFGEKTKDTLGYGEHGTTFGGNPICAAAALSVVKRIDDNLLNQVKKSRKIIEEVLGKSSAINKITGKGLMVGVDFTSKRGLTASDVAKECITKGLIVLTAKNRVRLLPSLNITEAELREGLEILKGVIEA
ncbi:MAG: aspartate aminotransferase family protein [Anaeroplasmataceae bacterium]